MTQRTPNTPVTEAELDAALASRHDDILPSSGFADSVMAAVAGDGPAPIPFPWKRIGPLFVAAPLVLAWAVFALVTIGRLALNPAAWRAAATTHAAPLFGSRLNLSTLARSPTALSVSVVLLSLGLAFLSFAVTRRLLFSR
ncbi:MAG: hypothetical protein WA294_10290 [Acidobacteriaceae bacterium]